MPVFISYSHADSDFVDALAANLVSNKARVWIDKWELNVGDSILDKVQEAIQDSSALLVVLSSASVSSSWCRKEINAGLMRELEEKKVFILPILLEQCEIPLFLKEKMYADFTKNFDNGLASVLEAIAKITNDAQGRIVYPEFHVDWAVDWGYHEDLFRLDFTIVEQVVNYPYTVLTEVSILANDAATRRYKRYEKDGLGWMGRHIITEHLEFVPNKEKYYVLLTDQKPQVQHIVFQDKKTPIMYRIQISCRKLGEDTGKDTFIDIGKYLDDIRTYQKEIMCEPTHEEAIKLQRILKEPIK